MIPWVDDLCKDWAQHKARVARTRSKSLPSTLGQDMTAQYRRGKRVGRDPIRAVATRGTPKRDSPEVWSQNALQVARAMELMTAGERAVMTIHYLYGAVPQRKKLALVHQLHGKPLSLRTYYRRIDGAHARISLDITKNPLHNSN